MDLNTSSVIIQGLLHKLLKCFLRKLLLFEQEFCQKFLKYRSRFFSVNSSKSPLVENSPQIFSEVSPTNFCKATFNFFSYDSSNESKYFFKDSPQTVQVISPQMYPIVSRIPPKLSQVSHQKFFGEFLQK